MKRETHTYCDLGWRRTCCSFLMLVALYAIVADSLVAAQDADRADDHAALIELREKFTDAMNKRDFEALKPLVTDSLTVISIDNEKVTGLDELSKYWNKLFEGDQSIIMSISVAPVADEKTVFFGDNIGIAQGTSTDKFEFRKAGTRELTTRWTAVVEKDQGQWKVARIHLSANVMDNPVIDATKAFGNLKMAAGALVGFLLGALLFRRRKAKSQQ